MGLRQICRIPVVLTFNFFPYLQVVYFTDLHFETSEEELYALCRPFGKVQQIKMRMNQALVELDYMSNASEMVEHFKSSPGPAKVRKFLPVHQFRTSLV